MSVIGLSVNKIPQDSQKRLDSAFKIKTKKALSKLNIPDWNETRFWIPQSVQDFTKELSFQRSDNQYEGEVKNRIKSFEDKQNYGNHTVMISSLLTTAKMISPLITPFANLLSGVPLVNMLPLVGGIASAIPTLPLLGIGGLGYIAKEIYDKRKMAYLGNEHDRRLEALERDPMAKFMTEEALKETKEDVTTPTQGYNAANDIAKKQYNGKNLLNVFIPYKKQRDSNFYEKNLGGRTEGDYHNIIPKTAQDNITEAHFSWLANNGTIVIPSTDVIPEDMAGLPHSNTGNAVDDANQNRKTAFMVKLMQKYDFPIQDKEHFHDSKLNLENYGRALQLFKAEHSPAKDYFEKIRKVIVKKCDEKVNSLTSLADKEKSFEHDVYDVIKKEARQYNKDPEFMQTLRAVLMQEWYNIKKQYTSK